MRLAPMTIAIASYQRRDRLLRLLRALDEQFAASDELARDVEVLVVLDGSTDGSQDAVEGREWTVPVRVRWQPNRGLAAARNVGLAAAAGRVVWFLDDDLVPSYGLVAHHRNAHRDDDPAVFVGPCRIPAGAHAPKALVAWWDTFYAELEAAETIDRAERFTAANASAPADLLMSLGGFDPMFVEYGLEDYELGVRLLHAAVRIRFDGGAIAWHPEFEPTRVLIRRQYGVGLNAARIARLHPETVEALFPLEEVPRPRKFLRTLRLRSPRTLMAVSRTASALQQLTASLSDTTSRRAEMLSRAAAHAAGVAKGDPSGEMLDRVLGYPVRD